MIIDERMSAFIDSLDSGNPARHLQEYVAGRTVALDAKVCYNFGQ